MGAVAPAAGVALAGSIQTAFGFHAGVVFEAGGWLLCVRATGALADAD